MLTLTIEISGVGKNCLSVPGIARIPPTNNKIINKFAAMGLWINQRSKPRSSMLQLPLCEVTHNLY